MDAARALGRRPRTRCSSPAPAARSPRRCSATRSPVIYPRRPDRRADRRVGAAGRRLRAAGRPRRAGLVVCAKKGAGPSAHAKRKEGSRRTASFRPSRPASSAAGSKRSSTCSRAVCCPRRRRSGATPGPTAPRSRAPTRACWARSSSGGSSALQPLELLLVERRGRGEQLVPRAARPALPGPAARSRQARVRLADERLPVRPAAGHDDQSERASTHHRIEGVIPVQGMLDVLRSWAVQDSPPGAAIAALVARRDVEVGALDRALYEERTGGRALQRAFGDRDRACGRGGGVRDRAAAGRRRAAHPAAEERRARRGLREPLRPRRGGDQRQRSTGAP